MGVQSGLALQIEASILGVRGAGEPCNNGPMAALFLVSTPLVRPSLHQWPACAPHKAFKRASRPQLVR
ncbi:hypothetical protein BURC_00093 [Burkholderiaceae bacterium]|nr:hypothetical protein BURC_00093 [Burkholderiaceae bacterium]